MYWKIHVLGTKSGDNTSSDLAPLVKWLEHNQLYQLVTQFFLPTAAIQLARQFVLSAGNR